MTTRLAPPLQTFCPEVKVFVFPSKTKCGWSRCSVLETFSVPLWNERFSCLRVRCAGRAVCRLAWFTRSLWTPPRRQCELGGLLRALSVSLILSQEVARHVLINHKRDAACGSDSNHVGDDPFVETDGAFVPAVKGKKEKKWLGGNMTTPLIEHDSGATFKNWIGWL